MSSWRYLAARLNGDGTSTWLDTEVPLVGAEVRDVLSGPLGLTGNIDPEFARLKGPDGRPLLERWSTALFAEADGQIRGGGILTHSGFSGSTWSIECTGFAGYAKDQAYDGSIYFVDADPLNIVRHIWSHLQGFPDGNIGLRVSGLTTPVRVGTQLKDVTFTTQAGEVVEFEAGPKKLNWWQTDDLAKEVDDYAQSTPFDYHERHQWNEDTGGIDHFLDFGYPRLGRRRNDLRFVLGENIRVIPSVTSDGESFANTVIGLGAGEGRDMVRGTASVRDGHLRRVATVADKSAKSIKAATALAARQLAAAQGVLDLTDVIVADHPHAPIGSIDVGDEVNIQAETGWADVDLWFRVTALVITPESGDSMTMTLVRSDRVGQ